MKLVVFSLMISLVYLFTIWNPTVHSNLFKEQKKNVNISKSNTKHEKTCTKQSYSPMPSLRNIYIYFNEKNKAAAGYQNSLEVKSGDSN